MSILRYIKKDDYTVSTRGYQDDYSLNPITSIDMTLSSRFLAKRTLRMSFNKDLIDFYPSSLREKELIKKIAKMNEVSERNIVLGAGGNGIFQNLIKIFFTKKGDLIVPFFSFSQLEYATTSFGSRTKRVFCKNDFHIDFEKIKKSINKDARAIFLCNPNNPTGLYEKPSDIIQLALSVNIPVIVSEAGIEFTQKESLLNYELPENLIVVRSFSKAYGLAGLRIGYAFLSQKYHKIYISYTTQFGVSALSLELAKQVLESKSHINNVSKIIKERDFLKKGLFELGIPTLPSVSNILMSEKTYSKSFYKKINSLGVSVVRIPSIEQEDYFRIAVQDHKTNIAFLKCMETYQ